MSLTVTDLFCGAGGSSLGASLAGFDIQMAANHTPVCVENHQRNFPEARHDCADISQVDPHRYPRTNILVASPECTNHSSAKGVSRKRQDPGMFDSPDLLAERSRATMWDVHRFVEVHQYDAAIIENVVDAGRWTYWPSWWQAWDDAGYVAKVVNLNSAHTGAVPQWRDRIYVVAVRKGVKIDLELRPPCWCSKCERTVEGVQVFKRDDRQVGKWRQQYNYLCPHCSSITAPPAPAVANALDLTNVGQRIGDRVRPLKPKTMARIERALDLWGPSLVQVAGHTFERPGYTRAWPLDGPSPVQTTTPQHAVVVPLRSHTRPTTVDEPAFTVCAGGNHHGLLFAPQSGGEGRPIDGPAGALTTKVGPFLVTYTRTGQARPVSEPATTVTTRDRHAVVDPAPRVEDCGYRGVTTDEQGRIMAFPDSYIVEGTQEQRTRMYGNAVTPPSLTLLAHRVSDALAAA